MHLILQVLGEYGYNFNVIPKSKEKYLALTVKFKDVDISVRFVDSIQFIPGSLSSWANKLEKNDYKYLFFLMKVY